MGVRVNLSPKTEKISETYKFWFNFQDSWEVLPYKPSTIWNGYICTMSWGRKMCQLPNSFKLMGRDEHMGGNGDGQQILSCCEKGNSSVNTPVWSINILLLLKPGYKLESLWSFDRLWFPVRKMVKLWSSGAVPENIYTLRLLQSRISIDFCEYECRRKLQELHLTSSNTTKYLLGASV